MLHFLSRGTKLARICASRSDGFGTRMPVSKTAARTTDEFEQCWPLSKQDHLDVDV
jgi:hypothetical protein